jgi:hypothetical protein
MKGMNIEKTIVRKLFQERKPLYLLLLNSLVPNTLLKKICYRQSNFSGNM